MIVLADGGFVMAGFVDNNYEDTEGLVVRTDSSGSTEWSETYGVVDPDIGTDPSYYDLFESVVLTSDGGIALAGYSESYDETGGGFWLVKLDSAGVPEGLGATQIVFPVMLAVIASLIWYKKREMP